jgi:cytoskeletal protein CcmA (bactofilin family)
MYRFLAALVLLLAAPATAVADDDAQASIGGNEFRAGGYVKLDERVRRNAFVSGGDVTVGGSVGRNLFAAGGDVQLEGEVEGDARMAGGTVRIAPGARVSHDATLAGGSIRIEGMVGGDLRAYGERITLDGMVGGDVEFAGDSLRLGPNAQVGGEVVYRSSADIEVEPGAQVSGGVRKATGDRAWRRAARGGAILGGITISLGMVLLGAVLVLGMPRFSREAAAAIRHRPWQSLGLGIAMLVGVPAALVVLLVTIIGIPLAVLLAFAYGALLVLGYLVAAIFVGDFALERIDAGKLASVWWRVLFLLLAIVAIALLRLVPVVGDLAWCLLFLAGVGAFTLRAWQGFRSDPAPA